MAPVSWSDEADEIIASDMTAGIVYATPAGGAVVTAVAPIGLHDREAGIVTFTTSLGLPRKLERIRAEPRVALAYHAREHGYSTRPEFVLVQGKATIVEEPDRDYLEEVVAPQAERFLGERKSGFFWDRWLQEYYADRIPVNVAVERVVVWPDLSCAGEPEVFGMPLAAAAAEQASPKGGTRPRVDSGRAAQRLAALPHHLLAFVQGDGYPTAVPVDVGTGDERGIALRTAANLLPPGSRRAGLLAHQYNPKLVGLRTRQHTGWLEVDEGGAAATYAPHTEQGFRAPANKTLLLLGNGFLAKRGLKKARKAQAAKAAAG